jgi:ribonuclease HI
MASKKSKNKFYVVWHGHEPGIYNSWAKCRAAIRGVSNARYKGFSTREAAERALGEGSAEHWGTGKHVSRLSEQALARVGQPLAPSICVDAGCDAPVGVMEYRGVQMPDRSIVFAHKPIQQATNNMGEFLALVHALGFLKKQQLDWPVYSDSVTALAWLNRRNVRSKAMAEGRTSPQADDLVRRALDWLGSNEFANPILKWQTEAWGEIPADYGRK